MAQCRCTPAAAALGTTSLSNGAKRGLLAFVLCGLFVALLWLSVSLAYVLGAQILMLIVVGKISFELWPDQAGLLGPMRRLSSAMLWACLYIAVIVLLGLWKVREYIAMPVPAIALLLAVPRTRTWLSDRLQRWNALRRG